MKTRSVCDERAARLSPHELTLNINRNVVLILEEILNAKANEPKKKPKKLPTRKPRKQEKHA